MDAHAYFISASGMRQLLSLTYAGEQVDVRAIPSHRSSSQAALRIGHRPRGFLRSSG